MYRTTLSLAMIGGLVASACSSALNPDASLNVRPSSLISHGTSNPDALYAIGRYFQGQHRYDKAEESYKSLVDKYPGHVDAMNALAVMYALQGFHDQAEQYFMKAIGLAPTASHLHNNLGYQYSREGRLEEAEIALLKAIQLDEGNQRARSNLDQVKAMQFRLSPRGAPSLSPTPMTFDDVGSLAIDEPSPPDAAGRFQLLEVAPQTYMLTEVQTKKVEMKMRPRLEVTNGNGVTGMARHTAAQLSGVGYGVSRVTNQKGFRQVFTEIQYRPEFEWQAQQLQETIGIAVVMSANSRLRRDVEVRIVLGKDLQSMQQLSHLRNLVPWHVAAGGRSF